jgi:hypothetical protein
MKRYSFRATSEPNASDGEDTIPHSDDPVCELPNAVDGVIQEFGDTRNGVEHLAAQLVDKVAPNYLPVVEGLFSKTFEVLGRAMAQSSNSSLLELKDQSLKTLRYGEGQILAQAAM